MAHHQVTVSIKVTVLDVDASEQAKADQLIEEDVLSRFPDGWAVELIQEPSQ